MTIPKSMVSGPIPKAQPNRNYGSMQMFRLLSRSGLEAPGSLIRGCRDPTNRRQRAVPQSSRPLAAAVAGRGEPPVSFVAPASESLLLPRSAWPYSPPSQRMRRHPTRVRPCAQRRKPEPLSAPQRLRLAGKPSWQRDRQGNVAESPPRCRVRHSRRSEPSRSPLAVDRPMGPPPRRGRERAEHNPPPRARQDAGQIRRVTGARSWIHALTRTARNGVSESA
jgi:hypothetical protein